MSDGLADLNARNERRKAIKAANTPTGLGGTPTKAGHGYARRFPIDVLPQRLGEYVLDVATRKQVPVDLPALHALACISTMAGPRFLVRRDVDWRQPLVLHVILSLPSGAAKSPAVMELNEGMQAAQAKADALHYERNRAALAQMKAERDAIVAAVNRQNTKQAQEEAKTQVSALNREIERLEQDPPKCARIYVAGDTTPEKLAQRMAANHGAIGILDHEGTFLRHLSGDMYRGGSTGNNTIALKGYDGDLHTQDRVTEGRSVDIERTILTIFIAAQSRIVAAILSNPQLNDDGLINRNIVCAPGDLLGQRSDRPSVYYQDAPPDRKDIAHRRWWADLLSRMVDYPIIGAGREPGEAIDLEGAPTFNLTRGAWKRHLEYERQFEDRLHPSNPDAERLRGWGAKHCGRVLRLSALLHIAAGGEVDQQITETTMDGAIEIGEWSIEHYLKAPSVVGLSEGAGQLAEAIDADERGGLARTEINKRVFHGKRTKDAITAMLNELVLSGRYHLYEQKTAGRSRAWILRRDVALPVDQRTSEGGGLSVAA